MFQKSNCRHLFLKRRTFGTTHFSKELHFRSTQFSLNFLSGYCTFLEQVLLRLSVLSTTLCKDNIFLQNTVVLVHSQYVILSSPFFNLKRRVLADHLFFEMNGLLLKDQIQSSTLSYGKCCCHGVLSVVHSFKATLLIAVTSCSQ